MPCVMAVGRNYGYVASTLRRLRKRMTNSRDQAIEDSRFDNSQQELQLLSHTKQLCGRSLPPRRREEKAMARNARNAAEA
jgi:hypothetical protein